MASCCREQNVGAEVPDPEACVKNKPMVYVENNPKINDSSVDDSPENETRESICETIDKNNEMLPCWSGARKAEKGYAE